MKRDKPLYPGIKEAEEQKGKTPVIDSCMPDFIDGKPNYEKYKNWSVEQTLAWLNID